MEHEPGRRRATLLLWALALVVPVGALLLPWIWPARSHMPAVGRILNAPIVLITPRDCARTGSGPTARAVPWRPRSTGWPSRA